MPLLVQHGHATKVFLEFMVTFPPAPVFTDAFCLFYGNVLMCIFSLAPVVKKMHT